MITYVIPTLWKDDNIFLTVEEFKKIDDKEARLVIINNTESISPISGEGIDVINMGYNSFVNPAWNLGVELANTEYVCLLNDDLHIDLKTLHSFICKERPEFVGFSHLNRDPNPNTKPVLLSWSSLNKRPFGFGQFMLFKKENWTKIPEEMKIFHGDDVIFFYHTLILGIKLDVIDGFKIGGNQSTTSASWWDSDIAKQDMIEYFKWIEGAGLECTTHDTLKSAWNRKDFEYKQHIEKQILT
jgi:hypothetical protein